MHQYNKKVILELQEKLRSKSVNPTTEEATKQWLVIPLLVALGYDPYSSDIIPEFTLDVGTKKGEKVDYVLQINNQPVALLECKQLDTQLSDKHISQLYRYFTISDTHIAILTNGDDYWFFTDSVKDNVMDLVPYYKIRLSVASLDEIDKLELYSRQLIQYTDTAKVAQYERYVNECKELANGLKDNKIPSWLLDVLADRSGLIDVDKPMLAEYLYSEIQNTFHGFKVDTKSKKGRADSTKCKSIGEKMKSTMDENKKNISNIKLNHEYVYNDYSDGDWRFHSLDYAVILGVRYDNINGRNLLINTFIELLRKGKIDREKILACETFDSMYKINSTGGFRSAHYVDDYDLYISTSYGISDIVKFIGKLLEFAGLPDNSVVVSFKN